MTMPSRFLKSAALLSAHVINTELPDLEIYHMVWAFKHTQNFIFTLMQCDFQKDYRCYFRRRGYGNRTSFPVSTNHMANFSEYLQGLAPINKGILRNC